MIKSASGNNDNPTNKGAKYGTSTESIYERNYRQNKFLEFFVKWIKDFTVWNWLFLSSLNFEVHYD